MSDKQIAVVIGANKGIGREIAKRLADLGNAVVVGARNQEAGEQVVAEIRASGGEAVAVALDVTDSASAAAAAKTVESLFGRVDALVNNAGISHRPGSDFSGQLPRSANVDDIRFVFETNVFGVINVTSAFLPLLRKSRAARIVNVSSSAGSFAMMTDPQSFESAPVALGYVPSKTALTAITLQYARDLAADNILVNAVCPGFVATDLNGHRGVLTPAEGAVSAVRMASITADGPTGTFTDVNGPVAW